ncbi:MAG: DEAD/DEAH box helicase family protein [Spirochaetaceae bacterium]|jgi:uncharacterized Zn finger protein/superfamily II DNA or RNA helicase|nr:DEAD/DEAH box helicase family protein [Spirochaetaceae bacterium]
MARVQYGVTPWGKWFMDVLESYNLGARLDRGRSYANTGKVVKLEVKDGRVTAKVKGHYRPYYHVEITFPPTPEKEQTEVKAVIENDPALLARIASGELPEEFLKKLKGKGIALIPKKWADMKKTCDCPDSGWYSTCKHIAALYFVLARAIDAEPDILFKLRGIDLKALEKKAGAALQYILAEPFTVAAKKTGKSGDSKKVSAVSPSESPPEAELSLNAIPHCAEFITSLLPPSPSFCTERDFSIVLNEFYHHIARRPLWSAAPDGEEEEKAYSRSAWSMECKKPGPLAPITLIQEDIHGVVSRHDAYDLFLKFREHSAGGGTRNYQFLFYLFKFINLVIASGAFIPSPLLKAGGLRIVWLVFEGLPELNSAVTALSCLEDGMLKLSGKAAYADGRSVFNLLSSAVLAEYVRRSGFKSSGGGTEFRNLCALFFEGGSLDVSTPAFRSVPQAIGRWLTVLYTDFAAYRYRVLLKENTRKKDSGMAFSLAMDVALDGKNVPLKGAAAKTGGIEVLKAPTALSNYLPEIRELMSKPSVQLSEERLVAFLDEASVLLGRLGIEVIMPKNLHRELKPRLVLAADRNGASSSLVSYLDLPSLLNFEWRIAIGGDVLSAAEFAALVKQKSRLVKFKDKFIRIDADQLAALFKTAGQRKGGAVTANDILKAHFGGDLYGDGQTLIEKIFDKKDFPPPPELCAELRPYQLRGYNWALSLLYAGFGCVIADDMGLGKTIQAIAVLLRIKAEGLCAGTDGGDSETGKTGKRCLVIAPAALLENWERELHRFAPSLAVHRYHGKERALAGGADVFLTTYQTAVRDKTALCGEMFAVLIVDEAHLLKNAATRGSKTVKALQARFKLALSGTPVENRLEDMRSLFDLILPGYLGSAEEFRNEFRRPIEIMRNKDAADRLRKIASPFLLRRLKTDKAIISDLPDKITTDEYAALGKEQSALYESVVRTIMEKLEKLERADDDKGKSARHALILQLLTSLKQICDHPRVYDKESPAVSGLSGKAALLLTLLEEILVGGEKVLIFSQYVETLECLAAIIRDEAGEAAILYHGGLTQAKRAAAVDAFQNNGAANIMLVSLRAGGLGLNLTAASRVIHYDLWYNPAVEAQATDRAFRIGQKRNVFVHRFITKNSFEEKIDAMLKSKKELADMTVGSGESWLASMSQADLRALFDRPPVGLKSATR